MDSGWFRQAGGGRSYGHRPLGPCGYPTPSIEGHKTKKPPDRAEETAMVQEAPNYARAGRESRVNPCAAGYAR